MSELLLSVTGADLVRIGEVSVIVAALVLLLYKELVLVTFDRVFAASLRLRNTLLTPRRCRSRAGSATRYWWPLPVASSPESSGCTCPTTSASPPGPPSPWCAVAIFLVVAAAARLLARAPQGEPDRGRDGVASGLSSYLI